MRRHPLLLLAAIPLLLVLALPAVASAGGPWVVKNAAGKRMGTAKTVPGAYDNVAGRVYGSHQFKTGGVTYNRMFTWFTWCKGGSDMPKPATVGHDSDRPNRDWAVGRQGADPSNWEHRGRIVKRHGRWVVEQRIAAGAWQKRGSVNDACPAWLAGGAVYLLVGPKWL